MVEIGTRDEKGPGGPSRYFFIIRWLDRNDDDEEGTLFLSLSAAFAYALRIIRELKQAGGYDGTGLTMIEESENGEAIYSMPF